MSDRLQGLVKKIGNITENFVKQAQMKTRVSGGSPTEIAGNAAKGHLQRALQGFKGKNNEIVLAQMSMNLVPNKKTNKYDPNLSAAAILLVRDGFPEDKASSQAKELSSIAQSAGVKAAAQRAMYALIRTFNSEDPGKYPDPNIKDKIVLVPRPRQPIVWDSEYPKDIAKI
jgi:hypothetical protein